MMLITFIGLIAVSTAAQLPSRNYLPQGQGSQGGSGSGSGFPAPRPQTPSNTYLPSNPGAPGGPGFGGGSGHGGFGGGSGQGGFGGGSGQGGFGGGSGHGGFGGGSGQGGYAGGHSSGIGGGSGDTGNRRPQQEQEKHAEILKQNQDVTENDFHYSYETSNGIRAEEAGDTAHSQGGFSYKGDDGNTYTITFTAGEGGFRPQGAHLPVAPPTPEDILQALEQNAKDEAAGIFDDGQYHPDKHGNGNEGGNGGNRPGHSGYPSGPSGGGIGGNSGGGNFGSANHQGSFTPNSGYNY